MFKQSSSIFKYFFSVNILLLIVSSVVAQEKNQQKEVSYHLEEAKAFESAGDFREATRNFNEAAMLVWEDKNYPDAIEYFNKSIELNKKINNLSGISKLHSNLGMIYSDLGEYEKSLAFFELSLNYRLNQGQKTEIISTYVNKAVVLNNLNQYSDAALNLEKALELATEMNDAPQMKSCYGMLAETYEKAGNQEKTLHYFNLYRTFHEMIQRNKVTDAKKETEAIRMSALQSELEKKEKELQLLKAQSALKQTQTELQNVSEEVQNLLDANTKQELAMSLLEQNVEMDKLRLRETEAINSKQKIFILIIGTSLLIAFLIAVLLFRNYRHKKQLNSLLSQQNDELEIQVENRTSDLQVSLQNLERRNQELDQFSHIISHNLRAPVANILGLSHIINQSDSSDPINMQIFNRLVLATKNLDTVVSDLSMILNVRDNKAIPFTEVPLREIINSVTHSLSTEIESTNATIEINDSESPKIKIVKSYAESILYNLISNAIKYQHHDRKPFISIESRSEVDGYVLIIRDNGSGISERYHEQIFQPYKRLTAKGQGKGLGLYITKSQVEAMNGSIALSSVEGKGCEFMIHIKKEQQ